MFNLNLLTCSPVQSSRLMALGITPRAFLWHRLDGPPDGLKWKTHQLLKPVLGPEQVPAWTKAELDAMIGPQYAKPDLWEAEKQREKSAMDPNAYPVFFLHGCEVFENGAQASARGLIWLLENEYIKSTDANDRYRGVFLKNPSNGQENRPS
jgi:hypothetical protein